jgi:hypothetical protein
MKKTASSLLPALDEDSNLGKNKLQFDIIPKRRKSGSFQHQRKAKLSDVLRDKGMKKIFENHCAKEL